jgi:hypothetical protein
VEEELMSVPQAHVEHVEPWSGEDVSISGLERKLASMRQETAADGVPDLRTSVMTHMAWVPKDWVGAAEGVLAGLADRHPSRTIMLVPEPDSADDRIDATLSIQCFPLEGGEQRHVCAEVIRLRLAGTRAKAPASIVSPLLLPDLPVFLRWRGRPPFGSSELGQMSGIADRLVVDSTEWPESQLETDYSRLAELFDRTAVSDIAWARTQRWRGVLARLWPGIAEASRLQVVGLRPQALLLAGWLRSRLGKDVELTHEAASTLRAVSVDGEPVDAPVGEAPDPSDLLSDELDTFGRDRVYEDAVRAAAM